MLSAEVTAGDCAAHPDGVQGRCRHCGSPEGADHDPTCRVYTRNPLGGSESSSASANVLDAESPVEGSGGVSDAATDAEGVVPVSLSESEVKLLVPSLTSSKRLVLLGERIYLRDGSEFRLLDNGTDVDLLRGAQLQLAEYAFLNASVDYWRERDRVTGVNVDTGRPDSELRVLRDRVQAAWQDYRELLDA